MNLFNVHPLTYFVIFLAFFTGKIREIFVFLALIVIHEYGHFLACKMFKWNVDKIYIYPFGGMCKSNEMINKSLNEELLILVMGPLFQIIFAFLFKSIPNVLLYNYFLLSFNLLPIYPLDGGRILCNIFMRIFPYKKSLKYSIYLSYLFLLITIFCISNYIIVYVSFFFLINKVIDENKNVNYYFNKFLLERYLYHFYFKSSIKINDICDMYKEKNNLLISGDLLLNEKKFLENYFVDIEKLF